MPTKPKTSGASRLADLAEGRKDVLNIDPNTIVITEGFNYRNFKLPENKQHLKDTRASIRINGVLNPLWVQYDPKTGVPVLIAGETRLRSVKEILDDPTEDEEVKARVKTIPVIQKSGSTRDLLLMSLQENTQKPPSKWEVGRAYQRLLDDGMTTADIATAMGQSKRYVEEALELEAAPPEIKKLLSEMAVTPAHALGTIKKHGGNAKYVLETQVKAAKEAVEKRKAAKAARKAADKKAGKKDKGGRPAKKEKPVTVKREKKVSGRFIGNAVLSLVQSALKAATKSTDVDIQMTAESALEKLQEALKAKE